MATTIFFNGILTSVPGSYSEVDASGLDQGGLGASGIIAILAEGEGGRPVTDMAGPSEFPRYTNAENLRKVFRSGLMREAGAVLFAPGNDSEILAGAQEVVAMKVNPATKSSGVLTNANGDVIDLASKDWGAFTAQINVQIGSGTAQGKLVTVTFEDVTESQDDLGGDTMFSLTYDGSTANAYDTMTCQHTAGGVIQAVGTRTISGLDSDITTTLAAPGAIQVVSNNAADVNVVTVYGLDGSGNVLREQFTLNGTTAVLGSSTFAAGDVLGVSIAGTHAGSITVEPTGGGADIFVVAAGTDTVGGMVGGTAMFAAGVVTLTRSGAGTEAVLITGLSATGAIQTEKIILTGTTSVSGSAVFSKITGVILGDVAAAASVVVSATAAQTTPAIHNTLRKVVDFFNARFEGGDGFVAVLETSQSILDPANLDTQLSAQNCFSATVYNFLADNYTIASWITANSAYLSASVSSGAVGGAPTNTSAPVFLSGGSEGTTVFSNYQTALDLLKQTRVNTIFTTSSDPAVHAAIEAHCQYMAGIGRNERDAFAGLQNAGQTDVPTKAEIKSQIIALNSRHIRVAAQAAETFNTAGERIEYQPWLLAATAAGMQAGSPVGTSLTRKYPNVLSFRQHSSWNPSDDANEMINAGLLFVENVEGIGRRFVRNVTTYLQSNNLAYIEGSVNEAANFAVYTFRTALEIAVGRKGFAGTKNAVGTVAIKELGLLVDSDILTAYRSLSADIVADVIDVSVEMAPIIPINFVRSSIHLVIA